MAAVGLSAWFGGVGTGLFSTLLSTLITNYFFLPPLYTFTFGKEDISRLGLFMLVTTVAVSLMRAQKQAAESLSHLGAIVASSEDAIIGNTLEGNITSWNAGAERILGYKFEEVKKRGILELVPSDQQGKMNDILDQIKHGQTIPPFETNLVRKDGNLINTSITLSPIKGQASQLKGISIIARDITDRKQAEEKLQEYTHQLHSLSRRLVEAQENERRFIARELHDEIGQILTGLKLIIEMLPHLPPEIATQKMQQAHDLVTDLLERISRLTLDLRPPILDDLGLLPTLLWHFDRYTILTNVEINFKHKGIESHRFSPDLETAAYRIVQEALTNVARHSGASQAQVVLRIDAGILKIIVEDDGKGFNPDSILAGRKASGLVGIRERAELLGGRLDIRSSVGHGTRLTVELPVEEKEQPVSR